MTPVDLKRLREQSVTERDHLRTSRADREWLRSELLRALPELLDEVERLRDECVVEEFVLIMRAERDEARAEVERLRHAVSDASNRIAKYHHTECDCRWCACTDLPDGWIPRLDQ